MIDDKNDEESQFVSRGDEPVAAGGASDGSEADVTPAAAPALAPPASEAPASEPERVDVPGWRPADYYAAPRAPSKFPRWVPIAAGVAAILAIGLMAGIGAFLQGGGLAKLVAIAFGQMNSEAGRMFDEAVEPDARSAFSKSLLEVRDAIADGTIELPAALPLLQEMQKATRDRRLSVEEVNELTGSFERSLARPAGESLDEPPTIEL